MNSIQYLFLHCSRTVTPLLGVQTVFTAFFSRSIAVQHRLMRGNERKFDFQQTGNVHQTAGRMCEVGPPRKRDVPLHFALFAPAVLNGILPCGAKTPQRKDW
jgi:hypothetical protein